MKMAFLAGVLASGLFSTAINSAAQANPANAAAAAAAEREAAEERYKQMSADIQSLLTAQEVQQKRLSALADELRRTRDEHSSFAGKNFATREELKELVDTIQEIDRKREADKKLILEEFAKLGKSIQNVPVAKKQEKVERPEPEVKPGAKDVGSNPSNQEGYYHEVQKGEYLTLIVKAYSDKLKEKGRKGLTLQQVQDANPNLDPKKLQVGQKVFIPDPGK